MYPNLFGIQNGSYTFMLIIGLIAALILFFVYFKTTTKDKSLIIDLLISSLVAIIVGIVFAILFQNLYNFIENPSSFKWSWSMTFLGGLIGGVGGFLLIYFLVVRKTHGPQMYRILTIAPASITLGHAFGRIGCFLAGCCYGKESAAWYSMYFPVLEKSVIPTQLFEAIFLFILSAILIFISFKKVVFYHNMGIYLISYGIFRFLIEFLRDDHRGAFIGPFSPSQFICFFLVIGGVLLLVFGKKLFEVKPTIKSA